MGDLAYQLEGSPITAGVLWMHVLIIGVSSVGIIETYKRWCAAGGKTPGAKKVILLSLLMASVSASMQMPILFAVPFCPPWVGWLFNLTALGFATVKFGYSALVKVPTMVIDKVLGVRPDESK